MKSLLKKPANVWCFGVGLSVRANGEFQRTVTVRAPNLFEAETRAISELDKRAAKQKRESPVAWDLTLITAFYRSSRTRSTSRMY